MWEDNFSQSLTSLLEQLQCKKKKNKGGKEHFPLLQKASGHFRWTRERSKDQTCAHTKRAASVTPAASQFNTPTRLGFGDSWACDSFMNHLISSAGFDLHWKSPQNLYHYWHQRVTWTPTRNTCTDHTQRLQHSLQEATAPNTWPSWCAGPPNIQ